MIAVAIFSCVGGTSGGGWDRAGWFDEGVQEAGAHDAGFAFDVAVIPVPPPSTGGGGSSSGTASTPKCGARACTALEVCVGTSSGPNCYPTCIASANCSTGCCVFTDSQHSNGYCAPKTACCGNTGAPCDDGQICAQLANGSAKCADTCTATAQCTITLCCASLKDDAGACLSRTDIPITSTCKP